MLLATLIEVLAAALVATLIVLRIRAKRSDRRRDAELRAAGKPPVSSTADDPDSGPTL